MEIKVAIVIPTITRKAIQSGSAKIETNRRAQNVSITGTANEREQSKNEEKNDDQSIANATLLRIMVQLYARIT